MIELLPNERIKDIEGYEQKYAITSKGRVWSYSANRFLTPTICRGEHRKDRLYINLGRGSNNRFYIHQLVAKAFLNNPNNYPEIDHIDTNPLNNNVDNLRWVTRQENLNNAITQKNIQENNSAMVLEIEDVHTKETYWGIQEVCIKYNVSKQCVHNHLRNKVKNPKWKYTGKRKNPKTDKIIN